MSKTQTTNVLNRKDLNGIAKLANLSTSTVVKWYKKKLAVKPETELRIYNAANLFYINETLKLKGYIQRLSLIENRISETKLSLTQALENLN